PEIAAFPSDAVWAISSGREFLFDDPLLRVDAVDRARRRHRHPELALAPLKSMGACAGSFAADDLALLESADLARVLRARRGGGFRQRTAARGRIADHAVDHTGSGREVFLNGLAGGGVGANEFAAIGGCEPDRFAIEGNAAGPVGFGLEIA